MTELNIANVDFESVLAVSEQLLQDEHNLHDTISDYVKRGGILEDECKIVEAEDYYEMADKLSDRFEKIACFNQTLIDWMKMETKENES